jgi:dolichol-phosphate mannosyltransferase
MAGADLSIIVPVYNEAKNIRPLVEAIEQSLGDVEWEVFFVDDDSPDGTAGVVEELARENTKVRLILRVTDRGLSKACIQGMLSSTADVLCIIDGDGQHDPAVISSLLAPIVAGEADIVSAARDLNDGDSLEGLSPWRTRMSKFGNALCARAVHREVHDPLTGLFAMRRSSFLSVVRNLSNSGFKLLFDILATDPSLRHREIPFVFRSRLHGESKLDFASLWQFGVLLIEKLSRGVLPARFVSFLIIGGSGVAVHFAVLYPALASGYSFAVSQTFAAVAAMTSNFLLNNQLTFRDRRLIGFRIFTGWILFALVSSVGLAANVAIATITFEHFKTFAMVAALAGVSMDVIWKFVVSGRLVWRMRIGTKV